jgi:carboxyl-terminal processing protease
MSRVFRHFLLFCVALVASLASYHVATGLGGPSATFAQANDIRENLGVLAGSSGYHLPDLKLLDRVRYYVSEKYIDPSRIDPPAMFDAALDAVERRVDSVLLQREPGGKFLHVSVGAYTTTLVLGPLTDLEKVRKELGRVAAVLDERLVDPDLKRQDIEYAMINGMLSTLDPHSSLLPPDDAKEMETENQGEFGGLGITIMLDDNRRLSVEYPLEDGPAFRAGIKSGDQILRINDESTVNMTLDEAVSRLRGNVGDPVTILVDRDLFQEPKAFTIVRETIKLNPPEGQLLEGGIGYIHIKNFQINATKELDGLMAGFRRDLNGEPTGLILDLRDDPGGYLNQAVEVASRFLEQGAVVVSTVGSDNENAVERARYAFGETGFPMVVLTSAYSASASEIVAGALRNLDRAAVFGERSFGKGSVQHLFDNADDSRLKLTVAQYLTPGDRSIQSVGIPPDVELVPVVIQSHDVYEAKKKTVKGAKPTRTEPAVSLLWRSRVSREADLDHHLEKQGENAEKPAYRLTYLSPLKLDEPRTEKRDLAKDWDVQFAREVLLNTRGNRRADVVLGASTVVARHDEEEKRRILEAFKAQGVDWSTGSQPAKPAVDLALDLGSDNLLVAGTDDEIKVIATNNGDQPVYQVFAVVKSDADWVDGAEFFFGRIDPGQSRTWARHVKLPAGYPTEVDNATLTLRDASGVTLGEKKVKVSSENRELPHYTYSLRLVDDGTGHSHGNGNGVPEVGETVELELALTNLGSVPANGAFARLRNQAGKDLDLQSGAIELGNPGPGQTTKGRFTFAIRGTGDKGWLPVELSVGCDDLFDYGSVVRAGFWDYAFENEKLRLPVGDDVSEARKAEALQQLARLRSPPTLEVTRAPATEVQDASAVVSGMVRDDAGVRDLIVYQGKRKVYYRGGEGAVNSMPFSVERQLEPGLNTFVFLAHDNLGLTSSREVSVYLDTPASQAMAAPGQ